MGHRYIGAKTRVMEEILATIKDVCPPGGRVCDLMCGTAAVSKALRNAGYRVTASDVMTYSYHHARTVLMFTEEPTFEMSSSFVDDIGAPSNDLFPISQYALVLGALSYVPPVEGYFWREFSPDGSPSNGAEPRCYFSGENAKIIDGIRHWIRQLHDEQRINKLEHSLLLHDLIMAANDVANIAGTYGHHLARLTGRARDRLQLKPSDLLLRDDLGWHTVLQGYAEDLASSISCDLCYIDPPYMKRQYAANYHILETLAREDEPEAVGVSGLRPWRDQYSNFCTKTKIRDSFRKVISDMDCPHFLVSYSQDGLLSLEELKEVFAEFGSVTHSTFENKRFRSNDSPLGAELTEYVIQLKIR